MDIDINKKLIREFMITEMTQRFDNGNFSTYSLSLSLSNIKNILFRNNFNVNYYNKYIDKIWKNTIEQMNTYKKYIQFYESYNLDEYKIFFHENTNLEWIDISVFVLLDWNIIIQYLIIFLKFVEHTHLIESFEDLLINSDLDLSIENLNIT